MTSLVDGSTTPICTCNMVALGGSWRWFDRCPVHTKPGRCADCGDGVRVPSDTEGPVPCPHDCEFDSLMGADA